MLKSPIAHAVAASVYIIGLVLIIGYVIEPVTEGKETIIFPMMLLSLLVLSVSIMGYLFFYNPLVMFLEGNKRGAVTFFLTTVATFAVLTGILISVVLLFSL